MLVFLLKWDRTIRKGMSLEGSKCIKIKRPAHLSIVERLGGFWRVQRYEDYSKPANFWGEILISHAKKYKAFTN